MEAWNTREGVSSLIIIQSFSFQIQIIYWFYDVILLTQVVEKFNKIKFVIISVHNRVVIIMDNFNYYLCNKDLPRRGFHFHKTVIVDSIVFPYCVTFLSFLSQK